MRIDRRERRDLGIAWLVLGVAFTLFIGGLAVLDSPRDAAILFALCLITVGVGFLGHELAHKYIATRQGRTAAFHAQHDLLVLTLLSALAGFLFAAPGAVRHVGPADERAVGLVAVAGPIANLCMLGVFAPLAIAPWSLLGTIGGIGVWINAVLAGFNMLPFGPLDGRTVWRWHRGIYALVAIPCLGIGGWAYLEVSPVALW